MLPIQVASWHEVIVTIQTLTQFSGPSEYEGTERHGRYVPVF